MEARDRKSWRGRMEGERKGRFKEGAVRCDIKSVKFVDFKDSENKRVRLWK